MTRADWLAFTIGTLAGLTLAATIGRAGRLWLRALDALDDAICQASGEIGDEE